MTSLCSYLHLTPRSSGIRLEGPKIQWARLNGGEGGSHPSNIHDNGYAFGSVNINGDTPVILTNEGPDMGGYMCFCTVASAEMYVTRDCPPAGSNGAKLMSTGGSLANFVRDPAFASAEFLSRTLCI
jgi:hypothetical protein